MSEIKSPGNDENEKKNGRTLNLEGDPFPLRIRLSGPKKSDKTMASDAGHYGRCAINITTLLPSVSINSKFTIPGAGSAAA